MLKSVLAATALVVALAVPVTAKEGGALDKAPPGGAYKKVSELVALPDFVPGLGQLYVDPKTLPAGPFLAYDHQGKLAGTVYMIPLDDMQAHKDFKDLTATHDAVDHVDVVFNPGHPGLEKPHYHVVLWNVSKQDQAKLDK
jgi:hypothetical protein